MEENGEELEPLFDYSRVQPRNVVCLDDNDSDSPSDSPRKRRKISKSAVVANVEKVDESVKVVAVVAEEEDWLLPPPKVPIDAKPRGEDSTLRELRLKKQELASLAQSADNVLRAVEESAKRELSQSLESALEAAAEQPSKPQPERKKIVISIQDKDGVKQFRIYMDDKFERLFKMYADKVKLGLQSLVFSFDGDKIGPAATPDSLGMEDNDIIEVRATSS